MTEFLFWAVLLLSSPTMRPGSEYIVVAGYESAITETVTLELIPPAGMTVLDPVRTITAMPNVRQFIGFTVRVDPGAQPGAAGRFALRRNGVEIVHVATSVCCVPQNRVYLPLVWT